MDEGLDRLVDLMEPDPAARKRPREAPAIGFPGILQGLLQPQPAPSPPPSEEESRELATRRRLSNHKALARQTSN